MPKIYGKIDVLNGLDVITGSLTIEPNSNIDIKSSAGKPSGIKETVYDNVIPTGSYTGSYNPGPSNKPIGILNYGLNNVIDPPLRAGGSQNQLIGYGRWSGNPRDYGLRLPSPVVGLNLSVKNNSNLTLRIFPSASAGQISQLPVGSEYQMYPGPFKATFTCVATGSSGEGTWQLQHNQGVFRTLTNTFFISHTSGSDTIAAVPLEAPSNSTNEFDNVAAGVYGFIDINGQGIASKGFIYPSSSTAANGVPLLDLTKSYPDPVLTPGIPKNPQDYMSTLGDNSGIEFITGVRLDTNVTSSDYYPNRTTNIPVSTFGGLCLFGYYNFLQSFNNVGTGCGYPYLPMLRDVSMDELASSTGGDINYDSIGGLRRVIPNDNPPAFNTQSPEIGQLYTEYFSPRLNGVTGGFRSNPMPVGSLINFTADYILDSTGNNAQPLQHHVPGNAWNIVIPRHYKTKTYKFRLTTEIYKAY